MTPPSIVVLSKRPSDWNVLQHALTLLDQFEVPYLRSALLRKGSLPSSVEIVITTDRSVSTRTSLPVLVVPVKQDSDEPGRYVANLQKSMGGTAGTLAIGKAGAINAALLAVAVLALSNPALRKKLLAFRHAQTQTVLKDLLS